MATVTNSSAFQKGSLSIQALLAIVTLGFYCIYWFYKTSVQFNDGTDAELNPIVRTIGLIIPIINLYFLWKHSSDAEAVTSVSSVVLFVLFIFFPPASWFLIQSGINEVAA